MTWRCHFIALALPFVLGACGTQMRVAEVDQSTGTLISERGTVTQATVLTSKEISLSKFNGVVFVSRGGDYAVDQMKATRLFPTVLSYNDLQKLIVANNLQDKVQSVEEPIGLSRLAKAYKPFLWVDFKTVTREGKTYLRMLASNPETLEELFVSEVHLDFAWEGVRDQNSRYPLFNSFIAWARKNQ